MSHAIDAVDHVYARSLFDLAKADGGRARLDEAFGELEQLREIMRGDRRFAEFLRSPIIDTERREASLRRIFEGRVSDLLLRFLLVVNRKGRLGKLEGIIAAFESFYYAEYGTVELDVWTAAALGDEQADQLRQRLKDRLGHEVVLHRYVDPNMIGGIRIRSGDRLLDASLSGQLRRLRTAIDSAGAAAMRDRGRLVAE